MTMSLPAITEVPIPIATHPSAEVDTEKQVSDAEVYVALTHT